MQINRSVNTRFLKDKVKQILIYNKVPLKKYGSFLDQRKMPAFIERLNAREWQVALA